MAQREGVSDRPGLGTGEWPGGPGRLGDDTHSRASSTSRARGAGLTTHTLGTFRATGSLGTSFTLDGKKRTCQEPAWEPNLTFGCRGGGRGGTGSPRIKTPRWEKRIPGQRGIGFAGSLRFGEQRDTHPLACGSCAQRRAGGSP